MSQTRLAVFLSLLLAMLGFEPRAFCVLGKCSITETESYIQSPGTVFPTMENRAIFEPLNL